MTVSPGLRPTKRKEEPSRLYRIRGSDGWPTVQPDGREIPLWGWCKEARKIGSGNEERRGPQLCLLA